MQKEFVLFAGHELKTPVTVMKASLDMLEREGIHSKYLDYAAEENEKMRKLVIELLDYSKMEYQEEKSFRESVNFSQCIEGISLEFEAMAFEKEVILITDIKQNLAIAQSIAAKHHTEITVISENGWNCFITSFPL